MSLQLFCRLDWTLDSELESETGVLLSASKVVALQ